MRTLDEIELQPTDRTAILEACKVLRERFPVTRIVLFGSKATGADDPESDIDLLVLTSCPADSALRDSISDQLFEIDLEHDVLLSAIVMSENDREHGLTSAMPIHDEVEEKGCLA